MDGSFMLPFALLRFYGMTGQIETNHKTTRDLVLRFRDWVP